MEWQHFIVIILCLVRFQYAWDGPKSLTEKFAWKIIEFDWPSNANEEKVRRNYIPENNLPLSIDVWDDKVFIAIPRYNITYLIHTTSFTGKQCITHTH